MGRPMPLGWGNADFGKYQAANRNCTGRGRFIANLHWSYDSDLGKVLTIKNFAKEFKVGLHCSEYQAV